MSPSNASPENRITTDLRSEVQQRANSLHARFIYAAYTTITAGAALLIWVSLVSLASCVNGSHASVMELCGEPPVIRGEAQFATTVQDKSYFCFLDDDQLQLEADISLTRQWIQCALSVEAR